MMGSNPQVQEYEREGRFESHGCSKTNQELATERVGETGSGADVIGRPKKITKTKVPREQKRLGS